MPSWKILDKNELEKWSNQLKDVEHATIKAQQQKIEEYYAYLNENNHIYGNLACRAMQSAGFVGRISNNYLRYLAQRSPTPFTDQTRQALSLNLAIADATARAKNYGEVIQPDVITNYHIQVFQKTANLSKRAWLGTIFEEHIGTGTWMTGQGPADQNGGQFTVENLNRFLRNASTTGTDAHSEFAHLMNVLLNNGVLRQTLVEIPISESVQTFVGMFRGLKGSIFDIDMKPLVKVWAQSLVRSRWHNCFTTIKSHIEDVMTQQMSNTPLILSHLVFDPMWDDKQIHSTLRSNSDYKCSRAGVLSCFLQNHLSVDPVAEASLAYENVLEGSSMPSEIRTFVSTCAKTAWPKLRVPSTDAITIATPQAEAPAPFTDFLGEPKFFTLNAPGATIDHKAGSKPNIMHPILQASDKPINLEIFEGLLPQPVLPNLDAPISTRSNSSCPELTLNMTESSPFVSFSPKLDISTLNQSVTDCNITVSKAYTTTSDAVMGVSDNSSTLVGIQSCAIPQTSVFTII